MEQDIFTDKTSIWTMWTFFRSWFKQTNCKKIYLRRSTSNSEEVAKIWFMFPKEITRKQGEGEGWGMKQLFSGIGQWAHQDSDPCEMRNKRDDSYSHAYFLRKVILQFQAQHSDLLNTENRDPTSGRLRWLEAAGQRSKSRRIASEIFIWVHLSLSWNTKVCM